MSVSSHHDVFNQLTSDLPVSDFEEQIVELVETNQVTIITAETGAGKSTQIPQYLLANGFEKVIVTQPRILAARTLSRRVREEWMERTGEFYPATVAYRTAQERDDTADTKILYCTDGLQLVREITGIGVKKRQILVLDEVHEWNENMEVLVAWAKKRCEEDTSFKVVIMSATIETDRLAAYFHTSAVLSIPGRSFPVTKQKGSDLIGELFTFIQSGSPHNILVFLPGKAEIQDVSDAIMTQATAAQIPVIPLHSQLELQAQQAAFDHYPNGKIILSTNIAQTSVTIDDIDIVIDSGLERRSEVRNGVEGLFIGQISQADCLQRAGRAGRTKAGEYILAPYDSLPCLDLEERAPYAQPEILRKHIDRLALRLANIGIDIETLDFYHDPSREAIARAKRTLINLGALTHQNAVTSIGRKMEQFPVESSYARMLVESEVFPPAIRYHLAGIIGIQEVGGITKNGVQSSIWKKLTKQKRSDLLAQYDVLLQVKDLSSLEQEEKATISKNIQKALEVIDRLVHDLGLTPQALVAIPKEDEDGLLRCIVAGQIDQIWSVDEQLEATHITTKQHRELSSSSVVQHARLVCGTPFDLQIPTKAGGFETLHLLQGITKIDAKWLLELAPQLFQKRTHTSLYFDTESEGLSRRESVRFGKQVLQGEGIPIHEDTPQTRRLFIEVFTNWVMGRLEFERRKFNTLNRKRLPILKRHIVEQRTKQIIRGVSSLKQLSPFDRKAALDLIKLETFYGSLALRPSGRHHGSRQGAAPKRRHGWAPRHKRRSFDD